MGIIKSTIVFLVLVACLGCSPSGGVDRHRFKTSIEDGVEIATTTGSPRFENELFSYELVLTLQENPEVVESLLSRPGVLTRDEEGNYYVVDMQQKRIAVFDASGTYVRSIGRSGQGPGEFIWPILQYVRDGIISVWDWRTSRETRFRTSGELLDTTQKPVDFSYIPRGLFRLESGGIMVFQPFMVETCSTRVKVSTYAADGQQTAELESPLLTDRTFIVDPTRGSESKTVIPFAPIPTATYRQNAGILVSPSHEPVLEWYDATGKLLKRILLFSVSNELTDEYRQRFIDLWAERLERMPNRQQMISAYNDPALLPETVPYWTYVFVDDAGYYWLRIPDQVYEDYAYTDGFRYYLLSPQGEYLGITKTPSENTSNSMQWHHIPVSVAHGYFMGVSEDSETGENRLNVYRITPAVGGFKYP